MADLSISTSLLLSYTRWRCHDTGEDCNHILATQCFYSSEGLQHSLAIQDEAGGLALATITGYGEKNVFIQYQLLRLDWMSNYVGYFEADPFGDRRASLSFYGDGGWSAK